MIRLSLLGCIFFVCWTAQVPAEEQSWFPSKYGADDTLGALNNLSAAGVLEAASLVRQGKVYSLAIDTGPDTPALAGRTYQVLTHRIVVDGQSILGENRLNAIDDQLVSSLGIGTGIDSLAHVGIEGVHYNGVPVDDILRPNGVVKYGINELPPIVGRGVMLDLAAAAETDRLAGGTPINRSELLAAMARQRITIRPGDIVLLHTGWMSVLESDPERAMQSEPGLGVEGAQFLADLGVVAVGSDNWGMDVLPPENPRDSFPVHGTLLARNGVYILENIRTDELAGDRAYEFLFVLAAPKFSGSVQGIVHPVAIR